jgi:hypothetical protein
LSEPTEQQRNHHRRAWRKWDRFENRLVAKGSKKFLPRCHRYGINSPDFAASITSCSGEPMQSNRRARSRFALLIVAASIAVAATTPVYAKFESSRAINIAQWFTWPRYEKAPATGIIWPPYKTTPRPPTGEDLRALKKAGFRTVRLPVDPAPFFVFEGERRESVYKILFDAIERIHDAGLNVVIDLHPNSRHPVWGQRAVIAGLDAPAFVAFDGVVKEMARRLAVLDQDRVALELMNEPRLQCKGDQQQLWEQMLRRLIDSARSNAPKLTLVVTGACVSSLDGLLALSPPDLGDRNLIFTFHFYEPFSFTHQGAQFIPWPDRYLDEVPWPASRRPIEQPLALIDRRVQEANLDPAARQAARSGARANLAKYYASGASRRMIDQRFDLVSRWAQKFGIAPDRILIGEFGVLRKIGDAAGALCVDRMRWLADVRESANRRGFAWAYFSYDGPFALVTDDETHAHDPAVLTALGFQPDRRNPCISAQHERLNSQQHR